MRNFQHTFGTPKRSFISAFSICTSVSLGFQLQLYYVFERPDMILKISKINKNETAQDLE